MDKNVAISTLNKDMKESSDKLSGISPERDPNMASKKLYELSEIYSTMKINETPEGGNESKDNNFIPNYLMDCLRISVEQSEKKNENLK